jgi:hypothetical protein
MSKTTRNTSTGKPGDPKVKRDVNRFNLLNDQSDDSDSDKEITAKVVVKKASKKATKKSNEISEPKPEPKPEPISESKSVSKPVSPELLSESKTDGFETVTNTSKNKKVSVSNESPDKVEKVEKIDKVEKDEKDEKVEKDEKPHKKHFDEYKNEYKKLGEETIDQVKHEKEIKDVVKDNKEIKDVKDIKDEKVGKYVPPVSSHGTDDGWAQQHKKKRNEYEDYDDTNRISYYNPEVKLNGDDMKLNTEWTVWIHENDNPDWSLSSYKDIYKINSIGSMWRFLWVLDNLNKNVRQYYIMRNGITPIWEDNNNRTGAICSIMIDNMNRNSRHTRGDLGVDAFTAICILVMNESFVKNNQDINGLCYSIKSRSALIKLWIKDYEANAEFITKLPITLLKSIDAILSRMESKNHHYNNNKYNNGHNNGHNNIRSKVSVQIKPIKPTD